MIHVVAIITHQARPAVRAEMGCIEYGATIDEPNGGGIQTRLGPDTFVVIQKWESIEAFKAHGSASHSLAYDAKVRDVITGRDIHVLSPA